MNWYDYFILAVILLRWGATPRDKNALSIVLVASFVSTLLVTFVTHQITGAWKLVIPGLMEVLTIAAMLKWSRNRTGYLNSGCLVIAWLAHVLCYVDLWTGADIIYSRYEGVIQAVALAQLACFHDTLLFNARRAYRFASDLGTNRARRVPAGSLCAYDSRPSGTPDVQTLP